MIDFTLLCVVFDWLFEMSRVALQGEFCTTPPFQIAYVGRFFSTLLMRRAQPPKSNQKT